VELVWKWARLKPDTMRRESSANLPEVVPLSAPLSAVDEEHDAARATAAPSMKRLERMSCPFLCNAREQLARGVAALA
jgi:hypothetical protein